MTEMGSVRRDTRVGDDRPVVVHHDDRPTLIGRPVRTPAPAGPPGGPGPSTDRGVLRRAVLGGVAAGVAIAVVLGSWLLSRGGEDEVLTRPAPAAAEPAPPAELSLSVEVPDQVVAGRTATIVVSYDDGVGVFSGSTEEWGDGIGTSSLQESRCGAADTTGPAQGTYRARHTWAEPGTYTLTVGVSSYTCEGGISSEEQASTTVDVVVTAP